MTILRTPKAQLFVIFQAAGLLVPSDLPLTNLLVALLTAGARRLVASTEVHGAYRPARC
jgi:hypothetical protein